VHLADRCGGERLGIEVLEQLAGRPAEFFDEDPFNVLDRKRRDSIKQVEEFVAVLERHDVGLKRQHLSELDETATEVFEQAPEPLRSGHPR
jgi:hypothetical protein